MAPTAWANHILILTCVIMLFLLSAAEKDLSSGGDEGGCKDGMEGVSGVDSVAIVKINKLPSWLAVIHHRHRYLQLLEGWLKDSVVSFIHQVPVFHLVSVIASVCVNWNCITLARPGRLLKQQINWLQSQNGAKEMENLVLPHCHWHWNRVLLSIGHDPNHRFKDTGN